MLRIDAKITPFKVSIPREQMQRLVVRRRLLRHARQGHESKVQGEAAQDDDGAHHGPANFRVHRPGLLNVLML